jgi:hypothetical protein
MQKTSKTRCWGCHSLDVIHWGFQQGKKRFACLVLYRGDNVKATVFYRLTDGEWLDEIIEDLQNLFFQFFFNFANTGSEIFINIH